MGQVTTGWRNWSGCRLLNYIGGLRSAMIRLPPDFREFLQLLNSQLVEYLLI